MADGTHEKVKFNVRVPPDGKQEWKPFDPPGVSA